MSRRRSTSSSVVCLVLEPVSAELPDPLPLPVSYHCCGSIQEKAHVTQDLGEKQKVSTIGLCIMVSKLYSPPKETQRLAQGLPGPKNGASGPMGGWFLMTPGHMTLTWAPGKIHELMLQFF